MENPALSPQNSSLIGKIIGGKYEIVSVLGQGGMSVVYQAKHFALNKTVALKMLLPHLCSDQDSVRRFLQEAKATGQLSHPNLVSVMDFGLTENGQAYLVMEFLRGQNLQERVERDGPIPWRNALSIFAAICDGLEHVHLNQIIHRDLKPSNIFLQQNGASERVLLVDFGIAKILESESLQLTRTGEVFGSPMYMSPEQCQGLKLDARSDIYSLGAVFYELLSGAAPLKGKSALDTMRLQMTEIPVSLQKFELPEKVPLSLENLIFKMMSKDPEKRHTSVAQVKEELAQISAGENAVISGNLQHMGREISRKSKTLTAAAVLMIVLTLSGLLTYPALCSSLAKQQFAEAESFLNSQKYDQALGPLQNAIELSRIGGDIERENKALGLVINVYRVKHDMNGLRQARDRKLKLIQDQLKRLGLNAQADILLSDELVSSALTNSAAMPSPAPIPTSSGKLRRKAAHNSSSEVLAIKSRLYDPDLDSNSGDSLASVPLGQFADSGTKKLATSDRAAGGGVAGGGGGAAGSGSRIPAILDEKPASRPAASGLNSGVGSSSFASSAASSSRSKLASFADSEKLDRLKAACEALIADKQYSKALKCAQAVIALTKQDHETDYGELARVYSVQAWAQLNLGQPDLAKASAFNALKFAGAGTAEMLEADAILALSFKELGNKRAEQESLERINTWLKSGVSSRYIQKQALERLGLAH